MKRLVVILVVFSFFLWERSISQEVFAEDFEVSEITDVFTQWSDVRNSKGIELSEDVPAESAGNKSMAITYVSGSDNGAHLYKKLPQGFKQIHARFYVKFLTRNAPLHHFVRIGGYFPSTSYPQGTAGMRPSGDDFFSTGIESPHVDDWNWGFYSYWKDMHGSGNGKFWGNTFHPQSSLELPLNEWVCVEFMVRLNDPVGSSNGEQAFWINGKKILHIKPGVTKMVREGGRFLESKSGEIFEGFQWRTTTDLEINYFWLNYYMTGGVTGSVDKVLIDDIVISERYIGPL